MKTIKEYLETLEEPYRTQALNNTNKERLAKESISVQNALMGAFGWGGSPEGGDYWGILFNSLDTNLPITPAQEPDELLERLRQVYLVDQLLREPKTTQQEKDLLWDDVNKYLAK